MKISKRLVFTGVAAILLVAVVAYAMVITKCSQKEITLEAGQAVPTIGVFTNWDTSMAKFTCNPAEVINMQKPGDYVVTTSVYLWPMTTTVHVIDTEAPKVSLRNVEINMGQRCDIDDFIVDIADATEVSYKYAETPNFNRSGVQSVGISFVDKGGNLVVENATLDIIADTESPVIEGLEKIVITEGDTISYKKDVIVTDNFDANPVLEIDADGVDTSKAGTYMVTYKATDFAGNTTEDYRVVLVRSKNETAAQQRKPITEEEAYDMARQLLAQITTPGMSKYEMASEIYKWVRGRVVYSETPKDNMASAVYRGIKNQRGDCYTCAMTCKALLDVAGINNFVIQKNYPAGTLHVWNVIDIGQGWHHFDTCKGRMDGTDFFYVDNTFVMNYSDTHNYSHAYDPSLYPVIP